MHTQYTTSVSRLSPLSRLSHLLLASAAAFVLSACEPDDDGGDDGGGGACMADTDCKGERICDAGVCLDPNDGGDSGGLGGSGDSGGSGGADEGGDDGPPIDEEREGICALGAAAFCACAEAADVDCNPDSLYFACLDDDSLYADHICFIDHVVGDTVYCGDLVDQCLDSGDPSSQPVSLTFDPTQLAR